MNTREFSPTATPGTLISSATSLEEIIDALSQRGCLNLTPSINPGKCSTLPLSGGGFGDVFRGELHDGTSIAIKSLRVYERPGRDSDRLKVLKRAAKEIYCWSKLDHPNVLPLKGLAIFRGNMSMISEWIENGDLMAYIRLNPNVNRIALCAGVCEGLSYIHARDMAHGDLKAANVMVSPSGIPKITDFGNCQLKDITLKFTDTTSRGHSIRWTAPELLREDNGTQVSREADVYAYGMVNTKSYRTFTFREAKLRLQTILEVVTGKVPFAGVTENGVIFRVGCEKQHPARPDDLSDDLWEIMKRCWTQEPTGRPMIASVRHQVQAMVAIPSDANVTGSTGDKTEARKSDPVIGPEPCVFARAEVIRERGNEFFRKGQYGLAIENYSKAITINPNEPSYLTNRAASYMAAKRFAHALADCRTAASLQSASPVPKTLLRLARCHLAQGDVPACLAALRCIPDETPGVSDVRRRTELLELHLQRFEDARSEGGWVTARSALRGAVELIEGDVPVQWRCWEIECGIAKGDWTSAQTEISLSGLIMFLTNQIPKAIQSAQQALRLDPDHKSARQLLKRAKEVERIKEEGNTFFKADRLVEAVERYGEALEAIGQRVSEAGGGRLRAVLLSNRATAQFKLKQLELALKDVCECLMLNPDSYKALRTRARIYVEQERFDSAVCDLNAAWRSAKRNRTALAELQSLTAEIETAEVLLKQSKIKSP